MSDVTSDVMTFAELKFILVKWRKGEFDVDGNDVKRVCLGLPPSFITFYVGLIRINCL